MKDENSTEFALLVCKPARCFVQELVRIFLIMWWWCMTTIVCSSSPRRLLCFFIIFLLSSPQWIRQRHILARMINFKLLLLLVSITQLNFCQKKNFFLQLFSFTICHDHPYTWILRQCCQKKFLPPIRFTLKIWIKFEFKAMRQMVAMRGFFVYNFFFLFLSLNFNLIILV